MRCPVCATDNDVDARVCGACKVALRVETIRAWPPAAGVVEPAIAPSPLPPGARTEGSPAAPGTPDGDDDVRFAPGRLVLGTYTIERQVGRGGMGAVYLARDDVSGQRVAVKVLPGNLARERNVRERFIQEARALAALDHPGIVPLITFAQDGDDRYLVMKYVEGRPLEQVIRAHRVLAPADAARIVREVCLALDYAHGRSVVHRDIKPANVLIDERGRVVVVDFGIARKLEGEKRLTQTGMLMGTPQYMAPEQIEGLPVDGRCDLYACGLLLFEMLAGRPPFDGERTFDVLRAHVEQPVPDVRDVRQRVAPGAAPVPDELVALVAALLQKDPFHRPKNGAAVADILDGRARLPAGPHQTNVLIPSLPQGPSSAAPRPAPPTTAQTPALPLDLREESLLVQRPGSGGRLAAALAVVAVAAVSGGLFLARIAKDVEVPGDAGVADGGGGGADALTRAGLLSRARLAREKGELDDARVSVDTLLDLDPGNTEALFLRVEILIDGKNPAEARATLARLPAKLPDGQQRRRDELIARAEALGAAPSRSTPTAKDRARQKAFDKQAPVDPPPASSAAIRPRPSQLPAAEAHAITAATAALMQGCYEDEVLARDRGARGEVAITVTVKSDGVVVDAKIRTSPFVNERFHSCVIEAAKSWRFPAFDGSDDVFPHRLGFGLTERPLQ